MWTGSQDSGFLSYSIKMTLSFDNSYDGGVWPLILFSLSWFFFSIPRLPLSFTGQLQGSTSCSKILSLTLPSSLQPSSGLVLTQMRAADLRAPPALDLLLGSASQVMMVPSLVLSPSPEAWESSLIIFLTTQTQVPVDLHLKSVSSLCHHFCNLPCLPQDQIGTFPWFTGWSPRSSERGLPSPAPASCPALSFTL